MKIGPKYKISRRLGVAVFEKTQSPKYAARLARRVDTGSRRPKTEYGLGIIEKQKARYSYGITSKQFTNYVKKALDTKGDSVNLLITSLESRLDNVVLRAGLAPTRSAARQLVSHGHVQVNGKTSTIPSMHVRIGDKISLREGSLKKGVYANVDDKLRAVKLPSWLKLNFDKKEFTVDGIPTVQPTELLFNPNSVLEFFSR